MNRAPLCDCRYVNPYAESRRKWCSVSMCALLVCFSFSSRRRHTRLQGDWSSDVCSSDLAAGASPVMAQFFEAKARQPDALVFFRMGDFYELFFDDAVKAAAALGIALTARGKHAGADIPMAGVPVHSAEAYLAKLIRAGFKVAVC